MKKVLILLTAAGLIAGLSAHVSAAPRGTTCSLAGKATFDQGLTLVPGKYGFSFKGKLTDCLSTGKVKSGRVTSTGTAEAACEGGTATGKATVVWNTGTKTVIKFSTVNVGALVTLRGKVTKSNEKSIGKKDNVLGELAFEADPTECAYGGVRSATFHGQVGGGSPG
jgi:hypothetical protein